MLVAQCGRVVRVQKALVISIEGSNWDIFAGLGEAFHFLSHSSLTPCILAVFSAATLFRSRDCSIDGSRQCGEHAPCATSWHIYQCVCYPGCWSDLGPS